MWSAHTEGPFVLDGPSSGNVAAGASVDVSVRSRIPASTPLFAAVGGALVLATNDPSHPAVRLPLAGLATGATFRASEPIDFGEVPIGGSIDLPLRIENKGENDIVVDLGAPSAPTFGVGTSSFTAPAKSSGYPTTIRFQPLLLGQVDATVPLSFRGAVCGAPPTAIHLVGRGVTGVGISPGKVDFGLVDCGTKAERASITLFNSTSTDASVVDCKFAGGDSLFNLYAKGGWFKAGDTLVFDIVPNPIPASASTAPNAFGDVLTCTTDIPGDFPHVVSVEQTAYGAVLSAPATTSAGRVQVDALSPKTISLPVTNKGNAPALGSGSTGGTATFPQTPIAAGATVNATVTMNGAPAKLGVLDDRELTYTNAGPICGFDAPHITSTAFEIAIDVAGHESLPGNFCVLGQSHRAYCSGDLFSKTLPDITWIAGVTGDSIGEANGYLCLRSGNSVSCGRGINFDYPVTATVPPSTTRLVFPYSDGRYRVCATDVSGALQCMGDNVSYEFGNGTQSSVLQGWQPAMTGIAGITDVAGAEQAALVVSGGNVYGAGVNGFRNILFLGSSTATAPTPILLPGLSNVTRVSGSVYTGCAAHADGTVSCWDPGGIHHPTSIVDAVEIEALIDGVCVLRQGGGVRCTDLSNPPNVLDAIGIATPAKKITPGLILEANGAVSYWKNTQLFKMRGFEGP